MFGYLLSNTMIKLQKMTPLHDANISRWQKILGYTLSVVASILVFSSGIFKFIGEANIMDILGQLELANQAILIGIMEIILVALYWIPRSTNLGFFFFCAYIGGITVAEILLGDFPLPGLSIGAMIYIGTLLRKPKLLTL